MTAVPMWPLWLRCSCTTPPVKDEKDYQLPDVTRGDRGFNSMDGKARLTKGHITLALPPCDACDLPAGGTRSLSSALPPMADDVCVDQAPWPPTCSEFTSNKKITALPPSAYEVLDPLSCPNHSGTQLLTKSNLREHNATQIAAPSPAAEVAPADLSQMTSKPPANHLSLPPMSDSLKLVYCCTESP